MSVIGNCTKTGAIVLVSEYGRILPADLFAVGDTVVVNFGGLDFESRGWFADGLEVEQHSKPTYEVSIAGCFFHKDKNIAVVHSSCVRKLS